MPSSKSGASQKRARSPNNATRNDAAVPETSKTPASPPAKRVRASTAQAGSETTQPKEVQSALAAGDGEGENDDDGEGESDEEGEEDGTDPTQIFPGSYDLYGMELPFMHNVYRPKVGPLNPEALYMTILKYQAKNDRTAEMTIPENYTTNEGTFKSGIDTFRDPMEEMPFDVSLSGFKDFDELSFESKYNRPTDAWDGPSIHGRLEIIDGGCGIASSHGTLTLQPLWKKIDQNGDSMELFEGSFTFRVSYSGLYSRKGHGPGLSQTLAFWGVRAAK